MRKVKKITASVLSFFLLITFLPLTRAEAAYTPPFDINSDVVYLVNTDTGDVIYEKNADKAT